jgi:hypothetical protein
VGKDLEEEIKCPFYECIQVLFWRDSENCQSQQPTTQSRQEEKIFRTGPVI